MDKKILLRFDMSYEHIGLQGLFASSISDYNKYIGKEFYLGDFLGKHTQFTETITANNLKIITDDIEFIEKFEKYNKYACGINPFMYVIDDE